MTSRLGHARAGTWVALGLLALAPGVPALAGAFNPGAVKESSERRPGPDGERRTLVQHGDTVSPSAATVASTRARTARMARRAAPRAQILSESWCGDVTTADTAVVGSSPAVKVVWARPSTEVPADRLGRGVGTEIQQDAIAINNAMLASTGGAKGVRFDLGNRCDAGFVDIASVEVPKTAPQLKQMSPTVRKNTIVAAVKAQLGTGTQTCPLFPDEKTYRPCDRNFLVFGDGVYEPGDGVLGVGEAWDDDSAGGGNDHNDGGLWSVVFTPRLGDSNGRATLGTARTYTAQHELLHTLGAVQDSAPHRTRRGHCWDAQQGTGDFMCYADGGDTGTASCTTPDAKATYDCGKDDYLNVAPAPSSYLATHWNVFDSAFLCARDCGAGRLAPREPDPVVTTPVVTTPVATTPVVTTPVVAPKKVPTAPTASDLVISALEASVGAARVKLKRLGGFKAMLRGKALLIPFSPPRAGKLSADLRIGKRTAALRSRSVRAGKTTSLSITLSKATRRKLRKAKGAVSVRLRFQSVSLTRTIGK